jgi:hypothetical protein
MNTKDNSKNRSFSLRAFVAAAIALLIATYTVLVVTGGVPSDRRIDFVLLVIILIGVLGCLVLLDPSLINRVRLLELKGFKIELLERLQERQIRQEHDLDDIRLIIPLLFRDHERKHLSNLGRGQTTGYHGGGALREELRRLCSIGLLQRRDDHHIAQLRNELVFDLGEYVELTDLGRRWVRRLADLEDAAKEVAKESQ